MTLKELVAGQNPKLTIVISPYDLKKLKLWAWTHGKSPSAYAGQILAARIGANIDYIEARLRDCAQLENISVEELIAEILNEDDD